jgi:glycosyltransferase involved in cell wall biosynthesis
MPQHDATDHVRRQAEVGISVLILTRDEEANLPDCLRSVAWCDDVVVVDSYSADRTVETAAQSGARVFQRRFDDFARQRNYAIDTVEFKHDWVFHLDADERFTPELLDECRRAVAEDRCSAFLVPSKMMLAGRWLRHAATYPVYQMRLMKLGEVRFIQHGHGQREGAAARGVGRLTQPYLHYSFSKGLGEWFERHDRYSSQEARECLRELRDGRVSWADLLSRDPVSRRRALKELSTRLPCRPLLKFAYMYGVRRGCLDGYAGLTYCYLQAAYERMICVKLKELRRLERARPSVALSKPRPAAPARMRILLLNQFYPPDTAATGQLLADVAAGLAADGHEVHVVCSWGSYEGGRVHAGRRDDAGPVFVHRVGATCRGRARPIDRLCDWASYYALAVEQGLALGRFDACLALTTPPFIAAAGALLKRTRGARLALWTMDLWPDVAEALGSVRPGGSLSRALRGLAGCLYRESDAVISLGATMTERLRAQGVPAAKLVTVHNWVPGEVVRPMPWGDGHTEDGRFVVMYSGNMGAAHEFGTILDAADQLRADPAIRFIFVGTGRRRTEVVEAARRRDLSNVSFESPRPLERLSESLGSAHVHLVSMLPGVEGTLVPSKIYGVMAAARPAIMVGPARNEVAQLLAESGGGFTIATGCPDEVAHAIRVLQNQPEVARSMGLAGRRYYERYLGRDRSVAAIVSAVTGRRALPLALPPPIMEGAETRRKSA